MDRERFEARPLPAVFGIHLHLNSLIHRRIDQLPPLIVFRQDFMITTHYLDAGC